MNFSRLSRIIIAGNRLHFVSKAIKLSSSNFLQSRNYAQTMDAKLDAIPLVDIDDSGRFKYILIKVYGKEKADGTEPSKLIVRGYKRAQWHGIFNFISFHLALFLLFFFLFYP